MAKVVQAVPLMDTIVKEIMERAALKDQVELEKSMANLDLAVETQTE